MHCFTSPVTFGVASPEPYPLHDYRPKHDKAVSESFGLKFTSNRLATMLGGWYILRMTILILNF